MSPRGFKFGLALFVVMCALFAAKLSLLGPGANRARTAPPTAAAVATPPKTQPHPDDASTATAAEAEVVKAVEAQAHLAPPAAEQDSELVAAVRRELAARGYATSTGAAVDMSARAAIMAFEADHGLRLTGEVSETLLHHILLGPSRAGPTNAMALPAAHAEDVIRSIQQQLRQAGHPQLAVDGRFNDETARAIRAFERQQGMRETGRVSEELVIKLQAVSREGAR